MAKNEEKEVPKMGITAFCNISVTNPREVFWAVKTYSNIEKTYTEWCEELKNQGLEVKVIK